MSVLGFMSVKLDREQSLLERLNEAMLIVQSESLGRAQDLGFNIDQIKAAKAYLRDFAARLHAKLKDSSENGEFATLVSRMREGGTEIADWLETLTRLEEQLRRDAPLPLESVPHLEDVLSILDAELTAEFNKLYPQ